MVMIKYKSKVSKGTSNRDSARVIIPQGVRKLLEINPGDSIEWIVNIENSNITLNVKKINE